MQDTPALMNVFRIRLCKRCYLFAGSSTGLIFIGVAADLGKNTLGKWSFLAVIIISIGNTAGRIAAGSVSDKIGRLQTLLVEFICQGLIVCLLFWVVKSGSQTWGLILFILFMIGLNYGANRALFPTVCRDYYGIRNFYILIERVERGVGSNRVLHVDNHSFPVKAYGLSANVQRPRNNR